VVERLKAESREQTADSREEKDAVSAGKSN
jgi:hypothetical protein